MLDLRRCPCEARVRRLWETAVESTAEIRTGGDNPWPHNRCLGWKRKSVVEMEFARDAGLKYCSSLGRQAKYV